MAGRTAKAAASAKSKTRKRGRSAKTAARKAQAVDGGTRKASGKTAAVKKTASKKATSKKATSKKAVSKKTVSKKSVSKKAAPKKASPKKSAPKKNAVKKSTAPKTKRTAKQKHAFEKVEDAQRRVKRASKAKLSAFDKKVLAELDELSRVIQDAKREIAEVRPDEVKTEHLPRAADELDAVVAATADATNTIMDACEAIDGVMANLDGAPAEKLMDATTRIYEACTFQDITGQRITKVVGTMKHIETRIDRLVAAFGGTPASKHQSPPVEDAKDGAQSDGQGVRDEDLLEGPQLDGKGKSQAEIDDLLASFD